MKHDPKEIVNQRWYDNTLTNWGNEDFLEGGITLRRKQSCILSVRPEVESEGRIMEFVTKGKVDIKVFMNK